MYKGIPGYILVYKDIQAYTWGYNAYMGIYGYIRVYMGI